MKIFTKLHVSINFSTKLLVNSLAPRTPYKYIFLQLSNFCPNFPEKIDTIFKIFEKIEKCPV